MSTPSSPLRRSPRKKTRDLLGSPSSRTRSALESGALPSSQANAQLAGITGGFAAFPSSPTRLPWDQQASTPDWYQLMVPELPEEEPEDEEYRPEEEDDEEYDEDPGTVAEEWEFDLEELLKDAQQEIVLPLQEDDDDDTEYEPDEEEEDVHGYEDDEEDDVVFEPSEFDLEELLRDAQLDVPILPKPLTALMEDLESDDEDYNPGSGGIEEDDDEEEEEEEDEEDTGAYDPLDFDIEALLRDAQQELMNPYTPQAQERMEQEMIQASSISKLSPIVARRMSMVERPVSSPLGRQHEPVQEAYTVQPLQPPTELQRQHQQLESKTTDESLSVKDLLSIRRDQITLQKEQRRRQQLSQLPIWASRENKDLGHLSMVMNNSRPNVSSPAFQYTKMPVRFDFSVPTQQRNVARNINTAPHNAGTTTKDIGIQENCEHCDRVFRGPKASTHKQQHIKRIHPENYVRKKGGKRVPPTRMIQFVNSTSSTVKPTSSSS